MSAATTLTDADAIRRRSVDARHVDPASIRATRRTPARRCLRTTQRCAAERRRCWRGRARRIAWFTIGTTTRSTTRRARWPRSRATAIPELAIPYHSRWRHFEAGGVDRGRDARRNCWATPMPAERARAQHRPRARERAARCRRRARLALHRGRHGPALHALRRPRRRELPCLHERRCSRRDPAQPAAGRCRRPARARCTDRLGDAFQVERGQSAGRPRRAARRCCAGSARRMREQPEVFGDDGRPGGLFDALSAYGQRAPTAEIARTRSVAAARVAVAHLAAANAIDSIAATAAGPRRHRAATRRARSATAGATARCRAPGLTQRLDAVPQALAVAHLLAARALRMGRRHGAPVSTR